MAAEPEVDKELGAVLTAPSRRTSTQGTTPLGPSGRAPTQEPVHVDHPTAVLERAEPTLGAVLLVADPDVEFVRDLATRLADRLVTVVHSADGADALLRIGAQRPDAILVAARLPVVDGATVVQALRRQGTTIPIVLGAGPDDAEATVRALGAGASACISRPYRSSEVAQLLNLVRSAGDGRRVVVCGSVSINPASYEVRVGDEPVYLPMREFRLLHLLMSRAERLVTRAEISARLWGGVRQRSNTITVHVRRLRERLGDDPHRPRMIQTVRGLGYRFVPPG
jgi:DNA-binding response OmpR family regulator